MSKKHYVLILPGLGDWIWHVKIATHHYPEKYGLIPAVYNMHWHNGETFRPKLDRLVKLVDGLAQDGNKVSVIGLSAGGGAAFNLLLERPDIIDRAVSVCARIWVGSQTGYRSFEERTKSSIAFAQSILLFEKKASSLTDKDKKRMMTARSKFFDQLVPAETAILPGATNIEVPMIEHISTIAAALTIYPRPIVDFVKNRVA